MATAGARRILLEEIKMVIVKAVDGSGDQEARNHVGEAFYLAALRAKETKRTQGLFCPESRKPFAAINKYLWGHL